MEYDEMFEEFKEDYKLELASKKKEENHEF